MAIGTRKAQEGFINLGFSAPTGVSLVKGDIVEVTDAWEANKPSAAGSQKLVGEVVVPTKVAGGKCTVECRGSKLIIKQSGAALSVGPVVIDANNKVIAYSSPTHVANAIFGIAVSEATGGDEDVAVLCP